MLSPRRQATEQSQPLWLDRHSVERVNNLNIIPPLSVSSTRLYVLISTLLICQESDDHIA